MLTAVKLASMAQMRFDQGEFDVKYVYIEISDF